MSDSKAFQAEMAEFNKFDKASDFLSNLYNGEPKDDLESTARCQQINVARDVVIEAMKASVIKLKKLKREQFIAEAEAKAFQAGFDKLRKEKIQRIQKCRV